MFQKQINHQFMNKRVKKNLNYFDIQNSMKYKVIYNKNIEKVPSKMSVNVTKDFIFAI